MSQFSFCCGGQYTIWRLQSEAALLHTGIKSTQKFTKHNLNLSKAWTLSGIWQLNLERTGNLTTKIDNLITPNILQNAITSTEEAKLTGLTIFKCYLGLYMEWYEYMKIPLCHVNYIH